MDFYTDIPIWRGTQYLSFQQVEQIPIDAIDVIFSCRFFLIIQGDSKRLLKIHVLITSIFHGVGDLKFYSKQL